MSCNFMQARAADLKSDTLSEISESGTTNSGWTSGWDSREDLRDFVTKIGLKDIADLHQDRFRVDRKKLEQMLSGDNEAPLPADIFFEQIMNDTNTFITWPSKLKVGAKSKKDPHVRIAGRPENVQAARERIMTVLDTRSNRVTMKMDVSYTDHSHIIGKAGMSIKRVMDETHCHVHFPDSNRSNPIEKSNQVSIAGDIQGVELARSRVRQKTPVLFGFELPIMSQNVDATCPYIVKLQEQYNVQVMFRTRPKLHATLVLVKGVEWEIKQVKKATMTLVEYLCENLSNQIPIQMSMEISPQHHQMVSGKNHGNVKEIIRATGAQIMFPDAEDPNIPCLKKSNVTITGNIHSVYAARQMLIGSLPLLLMFDLPENKTPLRPEEITELQNTYDVVINIRLKVKQNTMACIIKGTERSASNIYKARNDILGVNERSIVADIPTNYQIPSQPSNTPQDLPTPTPMNPNVLSPMLSPLISPTWHYPSTSFAKPQPPFVTMVNQQPQFMYNGNSLQQSMSSSGYQSLGQLSTSSLEQSREYSTYSSISSASPIGSPLSSPRNSNIRSYPDSPMDKCEFDGYEQKRLAGYKAMQSQPTGQNFRYPTGAWAGYGISHTSPALLPEKQDQNNKDDDVWKSPNSKDFSMPSTSGTNLNTSNFLDQTPANVISRITTTKWPDLETLLTSLALEKYIGLFTSHEIDLTTFSSISDKDLIEIGVTAFGARRKMLLAISELNKRANPFSAAPGAERKSSSSSSSTMSPFREKW
ncbi:PREDICTED: protein bicaudal C [Nicrophorus vespilloides]|uniref:Protein bicaudal C n=1 Tax=Nicrophorus vespilloides TaxID=110193 RepID=A0ABM1N9E7_NICVS|nr:PREDICTED: protein bicaudal C [Nicrophorus vespilloides]